MTYAELKSLIQNYLENTESTFVTDLPQIIQQAENRILRTVKLPVFRKNVSGTLTSGNEYLATPTDFLSNYSLSFTSSSKQTFLLFKDVNFIREAYPVASTEGIPKYYAIFDSNTFIVGPTPNANLTAELHYFYKPQSITESSDGTSWLGTNAESSLLYGSLYEAYTFMKGEPDIMQLYATRYQEALKELKELGEGYDTTDNYRSGSVRQVRQ